MMSSQLNRRQLIAASAALIGMPTNAAEPPHDISFIQDFDELWETLNSRYCFFAEKATDWKQVRTMYRPRAEAAQSVNELGWVLERVLSELYDPHTHLADPPSGTPRYPPYDVYVERAGSRARVVSVAVRSAAAATGLREGDLLTRVDGVPIDRAASALMPRCLFRPDPDAATYAWNGAVAGRRGKPRRFTIEGRGDVDLPLVKLPDEQPVAWRRLDQGVGLVRIASFDDAACISMFDTALAALADTRGLIIDVQANGGGDTAVARPIMGRFIDGPRPYALMRRRNGPGLGPFWTEVVEPRGPFTYRRPVVVVCNRWSASMAEGFPMGMRAICGAHIVGRPMMRLGAAVFRLRLDRTGTEAQYSAEPVYDVFGSPRWKLEPDVVVPDGADTIAAALLELQVQLGNF